jgi:hypothetical protein
MYELLTKQELDPVLAVLPGKNQAIIKPAARTCKELVAKMPAHEVGGSLVLKMFWQHS